MMDIRSFVPFPKEKEKSQFETDKEIQRVSDVRESESDNRERERRERVSEKQIRKQKKCQKN